MSHDNIPDTGQKTISLLLTFFFSIWTSIAMEVAHGIVTLMFALSTCAAVFFLNRYLKRRYK